MYVFNLNVQFISLYSSDNFFAFVLFALLYTIIVVPHLFDLPLYFDWHLSKTTCEVKKNVVGK